MPLEANLHDELEKLRKERDAFAKALKISNDAFVTKVKEFSLIKRMGALMRWNCMTRWLLQKAWMKPVDL